MKRLRSFFWSFFLRRLGVHVGSDVLFLGPVRWKFNGDARKVRIGNRVTFSGLIDLRNRENGEIIIEDACIFDDDTRIVAAREAVVRIGTRTAVGKDLIINAGANVTIGPDCLFSSYITLSAGTHKTSLGRTIHSQGYHHGPIVLGSDVWLASHVSVVMDSVLGDGLVCGPNSLVSGQFPANAVLLGVPAQIVGTRGKDCDILRLKG